MNPETLLITPVATAPAKVGAKPSSIPLECQVASAGWTRDVEALCRAIDKQEKEHHPKVAVESRSDQSE